MSRQKLGAIRAKHLDASAGTGRAEELHCNQAKAGEERCTCFIVRMLPSDEAPHIPSSSCTNQIFCARSASIETLLQRTNTPGPNKEAAQGEERRSLRPAANS